MADVDRYAPTFALFVEDTVISSDVTDDVVEVLAESDVDLASKIEVTVKNTSSIYSDSTLFAPGNQIEVWMGYGDALGYVMRGEIIRHLPSFPKTGSIPTLKIVAHDLSHRMAREELRVKAAKGTVQKKVKGKPGKESGRVWGSKLEEVITEICEKYDIKAIVDPALAKVGEAFVQKKGTSDVAVIRALANLYGAEFFVEYDPTGRVYGTDDSGEILKIQTPGTWVAHFRKPLTKPEGKVYEFVYSEGDDGTLLSFDPEYGLPDAISEVCAWVFDRKAREWVQITTEETKAGKSPKFSAGTFDPKKKNSPPGGEVEALDSMTRLKIAASGHSIEVLTRKFRNVGDATAFVDSWLQRYKDAFVIGKGELPGVEPLKAGQIHKLGGIGKRLSGDYYFAKVAHKWTPGDGFGTEFSARKVIT